MAPCAALRENGAAGAAMDDEPRELTRYQPPAPGRVIAGLAVAVFAPPVIAAVAGGLAVAVVVGVISLFAGLVGGVIYVSAQEQWARRGDAPPRLPRAQARRKP